MIETKDLLEIIHDCATSSCEEINVVTEVWEPVNGGELRSEYAKISYIDADQFIYNVIVAIQNLPQQLKENT